MGQVANLRTDCGRPLLLAFDAQPSETQWVRRSLLSALPEYYSDRSKTSSVDTKQITQLASVFVCRIVLILYGTCVVGSVCSACSLSVLLHVAAKRKRPQPEGKTRYSCCCGGNCGTVKRLRNLFPCGPLKKLWRFSKLLEDRAIAVLGISTLRFGECPTATSRKSGTVNRIKIH